MLDFIQNLDSEIVLWVQEHLTHPFLDKIMIFFTKIGDGGMLWIAIGVILLFTKKYRGVGFVTLLSLLIGTALCDQWLKFLIARDRPFMAIPMEILIDDPDSYSFPSGHTTSSFAAAFVLGYYLKEYRVYFYLVAGLVSFSRIYLFVHYPTDIVAGVLVGYIASLIAIRIFTSLKHYRLALISKDRYSESNQTETHQ